MLISSTSRSSWLWWPGGSSDLLGERAAAPRAEADEGRAHHQAHSGHRAGSHLYHCHHPPQSQFSLSRWYIYTGDTVTDRQYFETNWNALFRRTTGSWRTWSTRTCGRSPGTTRCTISSTGDDSLRPMSWTCSTKTRTWWVKKTTMARQMQRKVRRIRYLKW